MKTRKDLNKRLRELRKHDLHSQKFLLTDKERKVTQGDQKEMEKELLEMVKSKA